MQLSYLTQLGTDVRTQLSAWLFVTAVICMLT
jgi:hypothetical protein